MRTFLADRPSPRQLRYLDLASLILAAIVSWVAGKLLDAVLAGSLSFFRRFLRAWPSRLSGAVIRIFDTPVRILLTVGYPVWWFADWMNAHVERISNRTGKWYFYDGWEFFRFRDTTKPYGLYLGRTARSRESFRLPTFWAVLLLSSPILVPILLAPIIVPGILVSAWFQFAVTIFAVIQLGNCYLMTLFER